MNDSAAESTVRPIRVVYTFDLPPAVLDRTCAPATVFHRGNCATTMLRHSIRTLLQCAGQLSVLIKIFIYSSTASDLSDALVDLADAVTVIDLRTFTCHDVKTKTLLAAGSFGVRYATDDSVKFSTYAAGHSRIYVLPYELQQCALERDAGVLYLDNDTLFEMPHAQLARHAHVLCMMADAHGPLQHTCVAYERERTFCDEILGPGATQIKPFVKENLSQVRVVNNGILWFPASDTGRRVCASVTDIYTTLPGDVWCRYLHDMIAVSIAYSREDEAGLSHCMYLANDKDRLRGIEHYWRQKSQPEHMAAFLVKVMAWRFVLDEQALLYYATFSQSDVARLQCDMLNMQLDTDVADVLEGCIHGGILQPERASACGHSNVPSCQRSNLISMKRVKSDHIQPVSKRLSQVTSDLKRPSVRLASCANFT